MPAAQDLMELWFEIHMARKRVMVAQGTMAWLAETHCEISSWNHRSIIAHRRREGTMGKPSSSCFKIIGCGGGDAMDGDDDLGPEEAKDSSDKCRWSFYKRSSKHRVLSNTVISDPVSVCSSKQSQEVTIANFHSPKYAFPEKVQIQERPNETSPLPSEIVSTEAPPSSSNRSTDTVGPAINESDAVIVQSAIRGYLARKKLFKLESIVKLQAAVRGHLVRRQAIETFRCIQAVIRMQALVRAHHARQLVEKSSPEDKNFQGKGDYFEKSKTSIKKLLSNKLARQLLETTPRTKTIYIRCEPLKSDSAWKWLERWMAVASSGLSQRHEQNLNQDSCALDGSAKMADNDSAKEITHSDSSALSDSKLAPTELVMTADGKNSLTTESIGSFEFQDPGIVPDKSSKSLGENDFENKELKNEVLNITVQDCTETEMANEESLDSISDNKQLQPKMSSEILVDSVPDKLECKDSSHHTNESASFETLENEGKKSVIGPRKLCNPRFAAAQSKFEELSSMSTVGRSVSPVYLTAVSKSEAESNNIRVDSFTNNNEAISAEKSMWQDSRVEAEISEFGTEITVSSMLDSLDRSEMEGGEVVEIGTPEKHNNSFSADAENPIDLSDFCGNENDPRLTSDITVPQRPHGGDQTMANMNASTDLEQVDQHPAESTTSDVQSHLEGMTEQARSPEGTPRGHATMPDLHGTPSSDVSVNAKRSKKDNNLPTHRKRSNLVGKRLPCNPNNDSGGRSSSENSTKDSKVPKRRNSLGMGKTEHVDQEPRLSSSNSLPGYMQATASARAKAHVSTPPKSSPDMHDNQPKKRHSLPIENGKQSSSPRMQRSASQAQKTGNSNGVHSPHNSAGNHWSCEHSGAANSIALLSALEDGKDDQASGATYDLNATRLEATSADRDKGGRRVVLRGFPGGPGDVEHSDGDEREHGEGGHEDDVGDEVHPELLHLRHLLP
ncbi:IQ-domain [Musa troglodytarum]|uniref:IQ-domain n=1 Tax=Musa troglodytarum TaxID=320322 RepID=A0A9E7GGT0_9LILI|nr:IQ-domain [Musa troglodytarum]